MQSFPFNPRLYFSIFIIALLISISCTNRKQFVITVPVEIKSKNDSLIATVLKHFQGKDTFQLKAATFILNNMKYHYHYYGDKEKAYIATIAKDYKNKELQRKDLDSLKMLNLSDGEKIYDVSTLSASYLIRDIEQAIETYGKCAWKKHISFDVFCNYVLPYKVNNESIEDWRKNLADSFITKHGTIVFNKEMEGSSAMIFQWLHETGKDFQLLWGQNSPQIPDLPVSITGKLSFGACSNISIVEISALRAMGIPAAKDFTPNYLNLNVGHDWCAILLDSNKIIGFDVTSDSMGIYKRKDYIPAKVFRRSFAPVADNYFHQNGYCDYLPDFFNDPFLQDVTSSYISTKDVEVTVFNGVSHKINIGYLAIFKKHDWFPIAWGSSRNGKLRCKNIVPGGVYLPVSIDKKGMKVLANAILLKKDGTMQYFIPDLKNTRQVKLFRKCPLLREWAADLLGGKFQGANTSTFSDAVNLYEIKSSPGSNYNTVYLAPYKKFRYIRYLSPKGSNGNIAELAFYENSKDDKPISGKIIGTLGSLNNNPQRTREKVFDKDELSFFESAQADYSWVGLELQDQKIVRKLKFLARTDKNGIFPDNVYELLYWDNDWKSLGAVKSDTTQYLIYKNVPSNALLLLKNLTEGIEERIFTYENGKQVWW